MVLAFGYAMVVLLVACEPAAAQSWRDPALYNKWLDLPRNTGRKPSPSAIKPAAQPASKPVKKPICKKPAPKSQPHP